MFQGLGPLGRNSCDANWEYGAGHLVLQLYDCGPLQDDRARESLDERRELASYNIVVNYPNVETHICNMLLAISVCYFNIEVRHHRVVVQR